LIMAKKNNNTESFELRDTLLLKLMSGEVRIMKDKY
jgi:hypothetical protein